MEVKEEQIAEYGRQYEELNRYVFQPRDGIFDDDKYLSIEMIDLINSSLRKDESVNEKFIKVKGVVAEAFGLIKHPNRLPYGIEITETENWLLEAAKDWLELGNVIRSVLSKTR